MVLHRGIWFTLVLLAAPLAGVAAESWDKLKPGMTAAETTAALGNSLIASRGRDFEVGIYDGKGEVVFLRGQLIAWTSPASLAAPPVPSPAGTWQFNQQWRPLPIARVFESPSPAPRPQPGRRGSFLPSYRL